MVLDHTKVVYTAEDEQGFTFRQINDEDAAVELRARRKKRNRWVLIAFVALLIGMVVSTFFNFDGSDIFVCLYYVIVIFIAGACVLTENANIRQLRKKQVLQHDVVLVQKQPVIETESYGAENIREYEAVLTQYWEGMYIRDMRVRVSFQKKTIRKEKLVTR